MANQFSISIKSDIEDVRDMFFALSRNNKDRFLRFSINQVGRKAFTETVRTMSKNLGIKQYHLRGRAGAGGMMRKRLASDSNLSFTISTKSKHLFASEPMFAPKWNRGLKGVSAMYYGKRRTVKGSFLAPGRNSGKIIAFIRETRKRYPIRPVFNYNPAWEMMKEENSGHIQEKHIPEIPKVYYKKLDGFMSKRKRVKKLF